eukprot:Sdes_comp16018_c0_seq1m5203
MAATDYTGSLAEKAVQSEDLLGGGKKDDHPKLYSELDPETRAEVDAVLEDTQLTIRSLLIGSLAGSIVCVSNLYVSLKIGWSFSSSQFAALIAFACIQPLSRTRGPWKGYFGPKENCTAQTAGTASGMLSAGYTYAIPALYWLGFLNPDNLMGDIPSFLLYTVAFAFFGMFFAVPMRSYAILRQKLVFPTGTSTAILIRSIHESLTGATEALMKVKFLILFFILSLLYTIFLVKLPIMGNWLIFSYCDSKFCQDANTLGWQLAFDPQQIGAGMIMGFNAAASMMLGSIVAWVVIGPLLLSSGQVTRLVGTNPSHPSSAYVLLWVGVFMMMVGSFADLFVQYEIIIAAFKTMCRPIVNFLRKKKHVLKADKVDINAEEDPAPKHEQIPAWMWITGVLASTVLTMVVLELYFNVAWWESLIASCLGVILSFVCVQSAGRTDINPIILAGKATQLVFAGVAPNNANANLWAASVAAGSAGQSVDMLQDLKTGHLLRSSPRVQFYAQIIGTIFGIFASCFGFILFAKAYPCILQSQLVENPPKCPFAMPSVTAWASLALGLQVGLDKAVPIISAWLILGFCSLAIVLVLLRHWLPEQYKCYVINPVAFAIPFLTPGITPQTIMFFFGALLVYGWEKKWNKSCELFMVVVATGLIAGEGVGGVINAIIVISGGNSNAWSCIGMADGECVTG